MKFKTVIYDYDGTLNDPGTSIIETLSQVYLDITGDTLPTSQLKHFVGPPLVEIFTKLLAGRDTADVDRAVAAYRRIYMNETHKKCCLYADILDTLNLFQRKNIPQFIATARQQDTIELMCNFQNLNQYFVEINGLGNYPTKSDILIGILQTHQLAPETCCMIGDRDADIKAAKAAGITAVGALWGFGDHEELEAAGADIILQAPAEIKNLV